jgi:hypothetical protein
VRGRLADIEIGLLSPNAELDRVLSPAGATVIDAPSGAKLHGYFLA